jgi:hypothetical protein
MARSMDILSNDVVSNDVVEEMTGTLTDTAIEHEDDMFTAIDNYEWDDLDDEAEENVTVLGFDNAFTDAMDPDQHAKDVDGLLSYLGVPAGDPNEPWERVLLKSLRLE